MYENLTTLTYNQMTYITQNATLSLTMFDSATLLSTKTEMYDGLLQPDTLIWNYSTTMN